VRGWRRAVGATLGAVLAAGLALGGVVSAGADDIDDRRAAAEAERRQKQRERAQLEASLEDTNADLRQAALDLNSVEARLPVAQAELAAAQAALEEARRKAAILAQRLEDAQAEEASVAQQIEKDEGKVEAARADIVEMAREAYRAGDDASAFGIVTGAQSTEEFLQDYAVSSSAARIQGRTLTELQDAEALARNQQARLDAIRETIAQLKKEADANVIAAQEAEREAADRKAEVERLIVQQRQLKATIETKREETLEDLERNDQERDELASKIKEIIAAQERRDRRLAEERRRQQEERNSGGGSSNRSFLSYPVASPVVTSSYGMRYHPVYRTWRLHAGTDFRAYCGTPIYASASGTVVHAYYKYGAGNQVLINHGYHGGSSVMTAYSHLSGFAVGGGQSVSKGQVVGYSGTTGSSTACHLHFEVWVDGGTVDPMGWLP
jgi:murein DD-endopeptidase MepM/ murein hydrolase activator NlpD